MLHWDQRPHLRPEPRLRDGRQHGVINKPLQCLSLRRYSWDCGPWISLTNERVLVEIRLWTQLTVTQRSNKVTPKSRGSFDHRVRHRYSGSLREKLNGPRRPDSFHWPETVVRKGVSGKDFSRHQPLRLQLPSDQGSFHPDDRNLSQRRYTVIHEETLKFQLKVCFVCSERRNKRRRVRPCNRTVLLSCQIPSCCPSPFD